ncbi:MAG: type IV pilin N-terminal domain-containing protein [Thermoplasmata archaeon]|nr:type IV pilin N-terminal domain-containing protein [Thermoplasmata archaeon]
MRKVYKKRDDAVSPVIATILMVAITVVLAAVLYVMVIGMGDVDDIASPLGLSDAGRTTTTFTVLVASAPDGAMVDGTQFSFTHDNAVGAVTNATVYDAGGIEVAWWTSATGWVYATGGTADTVEYNSGMKIMITSGAVSSGDTLTMSSSEGYFGTTEYNV